MSELARARSDLLGEAWDAPAPSPKGKAVVICLGNSYMKDDGVGIEVAQRLRGSDLGGEVLVTTIPAVDFGLLNRFEGATKVILADAARTGAPPGTVSTYEISPGESPLTSLPGQHSLQLHDILDVARQAGLLPCPVTVVAVEAKDCGPGEGLTPEVKAAIPRVLEIIKTLVLR